MRNFAQYNIYLSTRFVQSLLFTSIVTVNLVYQATVVGLNPLQLVLVGTLLETVSFICEVPTGILADVYSRKLSTVIGVVLIGLGFMVEALVPTFFFVLIAQIIWGVGFTFVSGAREAWITDEIGEEKANKAFLHGSQFAQYGSIIGIIISVALASINIRLPIFLGGLFYSLWGICLLLLMREDNFHPVSEAQRSDWQHLVKTFWKSINLVKIQHILLIIVVIGGIFGMFSEGFDRLWTPFLLNFQFPVIGNFKPIIWFGIISMIGMVLSVFATEMSKRQVNTTSHQSVSRSLLLINSLLMVAVIGFGLAQNFYWAIAVYWVIYLLRETNGPLYNAWLNQNISSQVRATVFSISSQANAVGQIIGGPILGLIATKVSLAAAMVGAGLSTLPALALYIFTIKRHKLLE